VGNNGTPRDGRWADQATWLLLAGAVGRVIYAFVFNPDMMVVNPRLGVMNEWDLFAFEAILVVFLGLWWLRTEYDPGEVRDGVVVSVGVTAVVHLAGWVCLNAGATL